MNAQETALRLIPPRYLDVCRRSFDEHTEEYRLRLGRSMTVLCAGREHVLGGEALREDELLRVLEKATGASIHTAAGEMARGFVSFQGLRIGICGVAVEQNGTVKGFRRYSSLAIRVPHEARGACDTIYRSLRQKPFENTLILSPPGGGKTTALRELIRLLSNGGCRIGVVDERGEIAAASADGGGFDLGRSSDVLSLCGKREGAMMLLRGMNEEILAMDEITQPEDLTVIREVVGCGVGILATAHASGTDELRRRPLYASLLDERLFTRAVVIRQTNGERRYELRSLTP